MFLGFYKPKLLTGVELTMKIVPEPGRTSSIVMREKVEMIFTRISRGNLDEIIYCTTRLE